MTTSIEDRISNAVSEAEDAFWQAIARAFPEAKSGDLDPLTVVSLQNHMTDAAKKWVESNASSQST